MLVSWLIPVPLVAAVTTTPVTGVFVGDGVIVAVGVVAIAQLLTS